MTSEVASSGGGLGVLRNPWLRALLVHPLVCVAPWAGLCYLMSQRAGVENGDVDWGLWAMPLGAVASLLWTVAFVVRRRLGMLERIFIVLIGLIGGSTALLLGLRVWFDAAETACHGLYGCPF